MSSRRRPRVRQPGDAFENGTLDERTCGHRVRDLTIRLDQLRTRRSELTALTASPAIAPSAQAIQRLRDDLAAVFSHGTPGQRKAVIETHGAAIKIDGERLIPIFKIPTGDDNGPAETSADPGVRTTHRVVDRTWQYPNRAAQGPIVMIDPVRSRLVTPRILRQAAGGERPQA